MSSARQKKRPENNKYSYSLLRSCGKSFALLALFFLKVASSSSALQFFVLFLDLSTRRRNGRMPADRQTLVGHADTHTNKHKYPPHEYVVGNQRTLAFQPLTRLQARLLIKTMRQDENQ
jgi:hypothetical protein